MEIPFTAEQFYGMTGSLLMLYAMMIYPALGYFLGHVYPKAPTFGVPCPTTQS